MPTQVNQAVHTDTAIVSTRDDCRMCHNKNVEKIWSFGPTPLANAYLRPEQVGQNEPIAPLDVYYCHDCHLVQMVDAVNPELLFQEYLYVSSTSPTFIQHFKDYASHLVKKLSLKKDSLVIDVGSNDGILLKPFKANGMRTLGVEPAKNIAKMANDAGIETIAEFFTPALAKTITESHGKASLITANNVFAHTDNVDIFAQACEILLADDGVFVFEVQYLKDLLEKNLFDIVYHEHTCYYHVTPLINFFKTHNLEVFDVEHMPVHGGSIRVFVQKKDGPHAISSAVEKHTKEEEKTNMNTIAPYQEFAKRIKKNKTALRTLINDLKNQGKKIVGYGAPAKATTLCYAFNITAEDLDYIVDDDKTFKQGRVMPGTHIPIVPPEMLYKDNPDAVLILAWNFAEPIMKNHQKYKEQGGMFIVPVPEPTIIK